LNWLRFPHGDDPATAEPVPVWALNDVLDGAAAAGFTAVGLDAYTLSAHGEAGGSLDGVGAGLRARGLECSDIGVLPIGAPGVRTVAETLARVANATGAPTCIAAFFAPVEHRRATAELSDCADALAEAGVRLALEFASYGGLTRLADAVALCEAVGWERCGLLVDTWHFFRTGAPWAELRALDGEQIALVHVNDGPLEATADPVVEGRFRRRPVGHGSFPLDRFAAALDASGYGGTISTEVLADDVRHRSPEAAAGMLLQALRAHWPAPIASTA
jgi:sugar phosphate isomerase/epimerase